MRNIKPPRLITDHELEDCVTKMKQPIFGYPLMNFSFHHNPDDA